MVDDTTLVQKARNNDQAAFRELVTRYQHYVYRIVYTRAASQEDAEDLTQETFIIAFRRLKQIREPNKFKHWLRRIAVNTCTDWLRRNRQEREVAVSLDVQESPNLNERSLQNHTDAQRLEQLWNVVNSLSDIHRDVVILHYFDGYTYEEISEVLGIPVSTVQGRLQVARKELRTEFRSAIATLQLPQLRAPNGLVQKVMDTIRHLSPMPKGNVGRIIPSMLIVSVLMVTMALFYTVRYRSGENQQQAANQSQDTSLVFFDNFDDGNVSDWDRGYYKGELDLDGKLSGTPGVLPSPGADDLDWDDKLDGTLIASADAASGNYNLQFIKEQWGLYITAIASSPAFGPLANRFQVDFDILPDHHHYYVWIGEAGPFETYDEHQISRFGIDFNRGQIYLRSPEHPMLGQYIPNRVYHVTMVIEPSANLFDVTVTGPSLSDKEGNPVDNLTMTNLVSWLPMSNLEIRRINLQITATPTPEFVTVGIDNVVVRDLSNSETVSPIQ